jgi:hypothetical protein
VTVFVLEKFYFFLDVPAFWSDRDRNREGGLTALTDISKLVVDSPVYVGHIGRLLRSPTLKIIPGQGFDDDSSYFFRKAEGVVINKHSKYN